MERELGKDSQVLNDSQVDRAWLRPEQNHPLTAITLSGLSCRATGVGNGSLVILASNSGGSNIASVSTKF